MNQHTDRKLKESNLVSPEQVPSNEDNLNQKQLTTLDSLRSTLYADETPTPGYKRVESPDLGTPFLKLEAICDDFIAGKDGGYTKSLIIPNMDF